MIFVKIGPVQPTLYVGTKMDLYRYLSHLLTDLGEFRYMRSAHNADEHL